MMTLEEIVEGAVGPFDEWCDGYGNSGATGNSYISVLKLEDLPYICTARDQNKPGIIGVVHQQ